MKDAFFGVQGGNAVQSELTSELMDIFIIVSN